MREEEASPSELAQAEEFILADFRKSLDEYLKGRPDPRPLPADDRVLFALADRAVRAYDAASPRASSLPMLSIVQCLGIRQRLYHGHIALGPLTELLAIEGVEDIHINGADAEDGYLEFGDHQEPLPIKFESEEQLIMLVRYYVDHAGKQFDPTNPIVTWVMRDGSRGNAIHPPVAMPLAITIRKHQLGRFLRLVDLVRAGAMPQAAADLLETAVRDAQLNIVISGSTGSGKTTVARVLALCIPQGERTVVLETERELWLHELRRRDFISLEEREANVERAGRITLQDLFQKGALRQRPARIIVGEVRGKEALDMIHSINSGHGGALTTIHSSGPRQTLHRLEMLTSSADPSLSTEVAAQMVGMGVDLVVHLGVYRVNGVRTRRLSSLAFVDHNIENPKLPILQEFCRHRLRDDTWLWDVGAVRNIPDKVRDKLERGGVRLPLEVPGGEGHSWLRS